MVFGLKSCTVFTNHKSFINAMEKTKTNLIRKKPQNKSMWIKLNIKAMSG